MKVNSSIHAKRKHVTEHQRRAIAAVYNMAGVLHSVGRDVALDNELKGLIWNLCKHLYPGDTETARSHYLDTIEQCYGERPCA